MKKPKFQPNKFSLVIRYDDKVKIIDIPEIKGDTKKHGGKETYQMAIDAFTINFANEQELLDYLIKEGQIPEIERAFFTIEYKGIGDFTGNTSLVFNDNIELVKFIRTHKVSPNFINEYLNDSSYITKFRNEIIERCYCRENSQEYRDFLTKPNPFYGNDLSLRLQKFLPTDEIITYEGVIPEFCNYHNIRGNMIANHNNALEEKMQKQQQQEEKQDFYRYTPYNEMGEWREERRKYR